MSEEKRLYPDKWWSRQNSGTSTTTDLCFYLEELDELLCDADEVLSGTDIPKTGYISQTEKIYRLTDQVGGFFQYVSSLPYDIDSIIEEPLYYGFNKGATENLSRVHLEDIQTENTLGIGEEYTISARGYNYSDWRTKEYLTIADFMGNTTPEEANPYDGIISAEYVEEFARLFEEDYNNMQGCFEEGTTFDDYVRYLIGMGEFDHKMDQPFLQFLNGLTDLLIITAIIESVTGKELITGEDLTDLERGMKCVGAIVDAVSIGTAILTGGGSITLKSALRVWISELVTDASTYTVGYVGEQLGLPPAVTLILSLGVGSFVGYKMGKWAVEGIDGKVYTYGGNESVLEVQYSPANPGPLPEDVANSFNGATYTERVLTEDTIMYRVSGGNAKEVGSYMSMTPQEGGLQSQLDLALNPAWGNTTENVTKIVVPEGTTIFEGIAASQNIYDSFGNVIGTLPGGGSQVYIPIVEEGWFQ